MKNLFTTLKYVAQVTVTVALLYVFVVAYLIVLG